MSSDDYNENEILVQETALIERARALIQRALAANAEVKTAEVRDALNALYAVVDEVRVVNAAFQQACVARCFDNMRSRKKN